MAERKKRVIVESADIQPRPLEERTASCCNVRSEDPDTRNEPTAAGCWHEFASHPGAADPLN
jgi:hypothetical protein